jgi:tRNA dimethylallyltransferase
MLKSSAEHSRPIIVITGPTAVGKTKLAVRVAAKLDAEIINADSRQVYRLMDIGTGKDLAEYQYSGKQIPYHLINICEPGYEYNIKEYQQDFHHIYDELKAQDKNIILCGGSGLYVESALEGNPFAYIPIDHSLRVELADESKSRLLLRLSKPTQAKLNITSLTTHKRLVRAVEIDEYLQANPQPAEPEAIPAQIYVLTVDRQIVKERILNRLHYRLENGMIEEVEGLLKQGISPEKLIYYGLEYRWITMYLLKEMTYDEMVERLNISIRQFAKRQMTWFRRMEKKGYPLTWLDGTDDFDTLAERIAGNYPATID